MRPLSSYSDKSSSSDCGSSASGWSGSSGGPPQPGSYEYDCTSPSSNFKRSWASFDAFQSWLRDHEAKMECTFVPCRKEKNRNSGQQYAWKKRYMCGHCTMVQLSNPDRSEMLPTCGAVIILKGYPGREEIRGYMSEKHNHRPSRRKAKQKEDKSVSYRKREVDEDEGDEDDEECEEALVYINELIGLNKTADKLLGLTDPIHPIISAFLVIALNELVAGKKSRLSEEMEDTLDAVRMFLKGVVLEGETEGRVVPDGSKMEMGMDEKALERRWHEGTCPNCRKRVLLESKKKRKCTGAARELEDRILAAGLHCGR